MALPPPPGYGIASITFRHVGTPHPAVITCGFRNAGALTAAVCNTHWRTQMITTAGRPFSVANMLTRWSITETYVLCQSAGGVMTSDSNTTTVVGTKVGTGLPVNTSVVVPKTVAQVGRQYRGRMLFPPTYLVQADVDEDGQIGATPLGLLNGFVSTARSGLVGLNVVPYLLHQPPQGGGSTPAPTIITAWSVRSRIGTIRHRIRR